MILASILRFVPAFLSLRGLRWAYIAFVVLGLLYFPAKVGFRLNPHPCEFPFDASLAIHSLSNYPHIGLFSLFFIITSAQFRMTTWRAFIFAALLTIAMGALVEVCEGLTGTGNCRTRDLIPDAVGAMVGSVIVLVLNRLGWKQRPTWSLVWWQ